jgi:pimeloyl-ACP methyl ester carboxylesterase
MAYLGQYYRTYALDFWGFGESGKKRNTYRVDDFVALVDQFMEKLGIAQAPLVGHSMGGTVSLLVSLRYPERVNKVVVVGSPICGSSLALPLKLAGYDWIAFLLFHMMGAFRFTMRQVSPLICSQPDFPERMDRDLSRTTLESFLISIASLRHTDLRPELNNICIPAMGMFGDRDNIVDPRQREVMLAGIPHARIVRFKEAGHFIMLDDAPVFMSKLKEFLDGEDTEAGEETLAAEVEAV